MLKVSTVLKKARAVLSKGNCWIQGDMALSTAEDHPYGCSVKPKDPHADRFCAVGGVLHFSPHSSRTQWALKYLADTINGNKNRVPDRSRNENTVIGFNDDDARKRVEVLRKFDKAIKLAEADGR